MRAYETAGDEPPLAEVMVDPVIRHLRHYDGLDPFFRPATASGHDSKEIEPVLPQAA